MTLMNLAHLASIRESGIFGDGGRSGANLSGAGIFAVIMIALIPVIVAAVVIALVGFREFSEVMLLTAG